jgi:2-polyprenyl-6-methoxyphenol hydroxylase-like FAD-dependent oxidoreductase
VADPNRRWAVIAGAGIGGLCAAIALRQVGWQVTVLERRAEAGDGGAGISLWPNATRVLDRFGVAEELLAVAAPLSAEGGLRLPSGRWVSRSKPGDAPLVEVVLLHRADLHSILRRALPPGCLRTGVTVEELEWLDPADGRGPADGSGSANVRGTARVLAQGPGGSFELTPDLVVAADGVHSTLRPVISPSSPGPVYSGHTTWRGVTPPGAVQATGGGETWGRGAKFGYLPLTDRRTYWFAELNAPPGTRNDDERAALLRHFEGWHDPISSLVRATPAEQILRLDVEYLPDLSSYVRGTTALLGDAAHAMTPDLGQGGCQAIEDAAVLAAHLAATDDVQAALARYDRERRPRTQAIARSARRMGRLGQLSNPVALALRNTAIRLTPPRAALRPLARISSWAPPPLPPSPPRPLE